LCTQHKNSFARATIRFGRLRMILPNGEERLYGNGADIDPPVPKGQEWRGLPKRAATLRVLSMAMFKKIVVKHDVGMGEAYMDGDYVADDLGVRVDVLGCLWLCALLACVSFVSSNNTAPETHTNTPSTTNHHHHHLITHQALLALIVANARALNEQRGLLGALTWVGDRLLHYAHLQRSNTIEGSRRNIEEHYDAGNAMCVRVFCVCGVVV
jgi:hypothetical protein